MPRDLASDRQTSDLTGRSDLQNKVFDNGLVQFAPDLRAFALRLSANVHMAEDLVQETVVRALANRESFVDGTNQRAWLFTILRNLFLSHVRRSGRETTLDAEFDTCPGYTLSQQEASATLGAIARAIGHLPPPQRRAIMLVGCAGYSYEEAASVCGCAVGTIKSRVNRARRKLDEAYS